MKKLIIFLMISLAISACEKTISCSDPEIYVGFVSVPLNDIDTIVLRKFEANNNYQTLLDTVQIYRDINSSVTVFAGGDTVLIKLYNEDDGIKHGFDWQIFNPATNKTYNISGIEKKDTEIKCGTFNTDCFCRDEISNILVNNQNALPNTGKFSVLFLR